MDPFGCDFVVSRGPAVVGKPRAMASLRTWAKRCLQRLGINLSRTTNGHSEQRDGCTSYSQCGEDLILNYMFGVMGIARPRYLEIGAYNASHLSNTYFFYCRGCRGVCVEPNAALAEKFRRARPEDCVIEAGIGAVASARVPFYQMSPDYLSTFSKDEADRMCRMPGHTLVSAAPVAVMTIGQVLSHHFTSAPDFVSLDTEGLDLEIIRSFPLNEYRPAIFCIESIDYSPGSIIPPRRQDLRDLMQSHDYEPFSETPVNTLFIDLHVRSSI
jgi:FkbM family methyltransferase